MSRTSFAPGKIILSGEYGALFGRAGIAVPSRFGVRATFDEDSALGRIEILWESNEQWLPYVERIVAAFEERNSAFSGRLTINSDVPIGKGMGSSTALTVAVALSLIGDSREMTLHIENTLSPGNSGFDFAVIWQGTPILYRKGEVQLIELPAKLLRDAVLIDTGVPGEPTNELVAWMRGREPDIWEHLDTIGTCTERLMRGEPFDIVMRDHHKAQVALGVVPPEAQQLIAAIESAGGAGKVIGAGSRAGGAGMVLALGDEKTIGDIARKWHMPTMTP
ncbi:hypothetical protein HY971_00155 [Candidatus Kaiserbacteria bacterium]|nr:hypothetical protein [Candidatus Kaiserbacteria bacterium]